MESCTEGNTSILTRFSAKKTGNKKICECGCGEELEEISGYWNGMSHNYYPTCESERNRIQEEEEKRMEMEYKKSKVERLMKKSRLGKRFLDSTFENFKITKENEELFKKMKEYAESFNSNSGSILLHSHPGTGKTYVTSCVINELIKNNHVAIFVVVPDLLAQIRDTYRKDSKETEEKIMDGLVECDLLILDDLGAERHTGEDDWASEKLFSIINNRYLDYKPIIFTTNLSPNEMHKKLSSRTFSRICEMTNRDFVNMDHIKDIRIYGMSATKSETEK